MQIAFELHNARKERGLSIKKHENYLAFRQLFPKHDQRRFMKIRLFESFAQMIDELPAKAILKAVELERGMIEDDLLNKRVTNGETIRSILSFSDFLRAVTHGDTIPSVDLPAAHITFYRKTLVRLVETEELPPDVIEQFDEIFSSGFWKLVA